MWTEDHRDAKYPRLYFADLGGAKNQRESTYWLYNASYFRLKNLTLGYTLPAEWTEKVMIKQTRIYVAANDLFCISKYPKGWDPEMGSSAYPITTSVLFGLSVKF